MKRLEALADAILSFNGYSEPNNLLYKLRNPGGLKGFKVSQPTDQEGNRHFERFIDGYKALIYDLGEKCSGRSKSGLKLNSPLVELVRVFGMKDETTRYIAKFVRKALGRDDIDDNTMLEFFIGD